MSDMKQVVDRELNDIKSQLKPPSIAVIGGAGTGKSTLIKTIFSLKDSQIGVGAGLPQTKYYSKYPDPEDENLPIILYDSPGYEPDKTDEWLKNSIDFITSKSKDSSVDRKIHLIWYLVNASSARVYYFDKQIIETAGQLGLPVIIVLSQCDIAKPYQIEELKRQINNFKLNNLHEIVEISADPLIGKQFGLYKLIDYSVNLIPEIYKGAFISAQTIDIKKKKQVAWKLIAGAAIACLGSAYIPIPGSTAASILTAQTALITSIGRVYNVQKQLNFSSALATFSASTVLAVVGTTISDYAAWTTFMIAPLFVTFEAISAAAAATYIVAIGLAYASTLEFVVTSYLNSSTNQKDIEVFFKKTFKEQFKKYSQDIKVTRRADIVQIEKSYLA